jgi:branched-chain amino acid transport system substrate-binding protein
VSPVTRDLARGIKYFKEVWNMKSKALRVVITVCFLTLLTGSVGFAASTAKPIKVGIAWDLTGGYAAMGSQLINTALLWIDMVNKSGGIKGHPIEYVSYDGQSDANKSILAVKKLIELDKVHIVLAGINSAQALAIAPVCADNKVAQVAMSASELVDFNKTAWTFRPNWSGWEEVQVAQGILRSLRPDAKRLAVMYYNVAYGKLMGKLAEYFAPKRGFEVVAMEKYDFGNPDVGAQISNIIAAKPDVLELHMVEATGSLVLKQLRERGFDKPASSNGSAAGPALEKAFKDVYSQPPYLYVPVSKADIWDMLPKDSVEYKILAPIATAFEKKFPTEKYGVVAQLGTDAMTVTKDAVERALASDPEFLDKDLQSIRTGIRDKLETIKDLNTGAGMYTMTPDNHNGVHPYSHWEVIHYENGNRVWDKDMHNKIKYVPMPPKELYESML